MLVNKVKVKLLKVGSGELTNLPLQEYIAKKKLPTIVSTGNVRTKRNKRNSKFI